MNIDEIIKTGSLSAAILALVIAAIIVLFRKWIVAWVEKKATHGLDKKIEILKSELSTYSSLQLAAHKAAISSHEKSTELRLKAIETIWEKICSFQKQRSIFNVLSFLTHEEFLALDKNELKKFGCISSDNEVISKTQSLVVDDNIEKLRPFITEALWELYYVYRAFVGRLLTFEPKIYENEKIIWYEDKGINEILGQVLPKDVIQKATSGSFASPSHIKNILDLYVLREIRKTTTGQIAGEDAIKQSVDFSKIMNAMKNP